MHWFYQRLQQKGILKNNQYLVFFTFNWSTKVNLNFFIRFCALLHVVSSWKLEILVYGSYRFSYKVWTLTPCSRFRSICTARRRTGQGLSSHNSPDVLSECILKLRSVSIWVLQPFHSRTHVRIKPGNGWRPYIVVCQFVRCNWVPLSLRLSYGSTLLNSPWWRIVSEYSRKPLFLIPLGWVSMALHLMTSWNWPQNWELTQRSDL